METDEVGEELKQIRARSYPTYEEWKLFQHIDNFIQRFSSYPTYEEWKLFILNWSGKNTLPVLILPMRNGNFLSPRFPSSRLLVLILPMRNGNKTQGSEILSFDMFLSYL